MEDKIIKIGSRWQDRQGDNLKLPSFKVMGQVEKWVVMRRPRAMPMLIHCNEFKTPRLWEV